MDVQQSATDHLVKLAVDGLMGGEKRLARHCH